MTRTTKDTKSPGDNYYHYVVRKAVDEIRADILDSEVQSYEKLILFGKVENILDLRKSDKNGRYYIWFTVSTRYVEKGRTRKKYWRCFATEKIARTIHDSYEVGDWLKITDSNVTISYGYRNGVQDKSKPNLGVYVQEVQPKWMTELAPPLKLEILGHIERNREHLKET